jgi:hypothetical protein
VSRHRRRPRTASIIRGFQEAALSRGGKRGGRGRPIAELASLRDENADIRRRLFEGELLPSVAAVAVQSINTDIRAVRHVEGKGTGRDSREAR